MRSSVFGAALLGLAAAVIPPGPIGQLRKSVEAFPAGGDTDPSLLYPEYNLSVPIDHFHNESRYEPHSDGKFNLRYWFDDTYYKPGGPVILFESGESDASSRLPILQKGIVYKLTKAVGGLGVIIEHRYYGTSMPTPDLSTENLRFLTTDQALADTVYFAQNIVFKGHEKQDLTAKSVPWIAYGGSYSGAFVAFLRTQYPGVFFGSISSSGVTEAIVDYWQYYAPIAQYGPKQCIQTIQKLVDVFDKILIDNKGSSYVSQLKQIYGLSSVQYDDDFAQVITYGPSDWQGRNWDPAVNSPGFDEWCGNITSPTVLDPATNSLTGTIDSLIKVAGYSPDELRVAMQNHISYVNITAVQPSPYDVGIYYNTHNQTYYDQDDYSQQGWRSWSYQYCDQWGFLQDGASVPADQKPLISRTITLDYTRIVCEKAFNITRLPDAQAINSRGGYKIQYPRLALIDGEVDPWRPACPHSPNAVPWTQRDSVDTPFYLIPNSVHHWDENGVFDNQTTADFPPQYIQKIQAYEVEFVKAWLKEYKKPGYGGGSGGGWGWGGYGGNGGGWWGGHFGRGWL